MTYPQIEGVINDMMARVKATGITHAETVAGFTVRLYPNGAFMVGANLFNTHSGMETARWIHGAPVNSRDARRAYRSCESWRARLCGHARPYVYGRRRELGTVYSGNDMVQAFRDYDDYVSQSQAGYGRASGEPVTLMLNGEISREYAPKKGLCGYVAFYQGKRVEVYAETLYAAHKQVAAQLKVPAKKQHLISVTLCERADG